MSTLWNVVYGNYFPREVESTWSTEAMAEARIEILEAEQDAQGLGIGMWWAEKLEISEPSPADFVFSPEP